jgi:hypothetical protein
MKDLTIGFFTGAFVMFYLMYRTMVAHVNKWRCGSDNPRKKGEL